MAQEMYKSNIFLVRVRSVERTETITKVVTEWNGRDSDDLCGQDRREVRTTVMIPEIKVSVWSCDHMTEFNAQSEMIKEANKILPNHLKLEFEKTPIEFHRLGKELLEEFTVEEKDLDCDPGSYIVLVHRGIRGQYISQIVKFDCNKETLITPNMEIKGSEVEMVEDFIFGPDIQDIVIEPERLDERYSL